MTQNQTTGAAEQMIAELIGVESSLDEARQRLRKALALGPVAARATATPWDPDDDGDHSAFTHRDDDEPPPYVREVEARATAPAGLDAPFLGRCGCPCPCHRDEALPEWPGSCAACCDPELGRYVCRCLPAIASALKGVSEARATAPAGLREAAERVVEAWDTNRPVGMLIYRLRALLAASGETEQDQRKCPICGGDETDERGHLAHALALAADSEPER